MSLNFKPFFSIALCVFFISCKTLKDKGNNTTEISLKNTEWVTAIFDPTSNTFIKSEKEDVFISFKANNRFALYKSPKLIEGKSKAGTWERKGQKLIIELRSLETKGAKTSNPLNEIYTYRIKRQTTESLVLETDDLENFTSNTIFLIKR